MKLYIMYKVIFKIDSNSQQNSASTLKKSGFIPIYFKKINGKEVYTALYRSNDLNELKEAIIDLAFLLVREGKKGGKDFVTIYSVDDKYIGKGVGSLLGAGLGLKLGGIPGMLLGFLGGIVLGELADIEMGEKLVGVWEWPTSIAY